MSNLPEKTKMYEVCPHCGHKLSPWQQILLSVDRTLMCKNCWYRIFLDKNGEMKVSRGTSFSEEEK